VDGRRLLAAALSTVGLLVLLSSGPGMVHAEWTSIPLPAHVAYLSALTAGSSHLFAAMCDSSGNYLGVMRTPLAAPGTWENLGQSGRFIRKIIVGGPEDSFILVPGSGTTDIIGSTDGGSTWIPRDAGIENDDRWIINLSWNGQFPGRVYASATNPGMWIYVSTDFGATWSMWTLCEGCSGQFRYLATPQDGGVKSYAMNLTGYDEDRPYKTTDGGTTWHTVPTQSPSWVPFNDLDVSTDSRDLYMTTYSGIVWWRDDTIQNPMIPPLGYEGMTAAEAPTWAPGRLFVAGVDASGKLCVTYSSDPWTDWTILSDGFPGVTSPAPLWNAEKFQLAASRNTPQLFYSTWGLGLWVRDLRADLADVNAGPRSAALGLQVSQPWPNPAAGDISILSRVSSGQDVQVEVLDCAGRALCRLGGRTTGEGTVFVWNGRLANTPAPAGVYYIRATSGNQSATRRLVLLD
jgi:hypothetical protein